MYIPYEKDGDIFYGLVKKKNKAIGMLDRLSLRE